jgi:hypothetical protein
VVEPRALDLSASAHRAVVRHHFFSLDAQVVDAGCSSAENVRDCDGAQIASHGVSQRSVLPSTTARQQLRAQHVAEHCHRAALV